MSLWISIPSVRPGPVAEVAFEVERPQTLEAAIAFFRRYCSPEEVFSEEELTGVDRMRREKLEDRIEDLDSELRSAEDEADENETRAEEAEEELAQAKRKILGLEARLDVPRETPGGAL